MLRAAVTVRLSGTPLCWVGQAAVVPEASGETFVPSRSRSPKGHPQGLMLRTSLSVLLSGACMALLQGLWSGSHP